MPKVKDTYQTTTGNIAVRGESGDVWVIRKTWLDDSMSKNEKLEKAIDLFLADTMIAFEKYNDKRHGLLHI